MKSNLKKQIAPYWDEERGGVVIPLLGIVLDAKKIAYKENWDSAHALCTAVGKRMFTKQEACVLMWQKDEINPILEEHHGELLDGWFWTDTKYENGFKTHAWYVVFGSGVFGSLYGYKYNTYIVRAVSAL